jgi:hypothetical protein
VKKGGGKVADWEKQLGLWHEYDRSFAERALFAKRSVNPMFVLRTSTGTTIPLVSGWTNDDERQGCHDLVRLLCIALDVLAIGHMGEAWMLMGADAMAGVRPSMSPTRRECLVVSMQSRDSRGEPWRRVDVREIIRSDGSSGRPKSLRRLPDLNSENAWEIHDLLPPADLPEALRREAAERLAEMGVKLPHELRQGRPDRRH